MDFIELLTAMLIAVFVVLIVCVAPIIIGTVLIRKTQYKKYGIALRILGYLLIIPTVTIAIIMLLIMKEKIV